MDPFGRKIDYLRISVTDRCNERCRYCMPQGYKGWEATADHLSADEILEIVRSCVDLGVRKFRLTGGEPLLRKDIVYIVEGIAGLRGVEGVALSTNGLKLPSLAHALRDAGLSSINLSLDSVNPDRYQYMTGGKLSRVLEGLEAAQEAGFQRIKVNSVLMRGFSEPELWPLAEFAAQHGLIWRMIELMPLTSREVLRPENFFSVLEAMSLLREYDVLVPDSSNGHGWGPATYYRLLRLGSVVGFIGAMTDSCFCDRCNKMRLTADGKIRPCLGDAGEIDARAVLRDTVPGSIDEVIRQAIRQKPEKHQFTDNYQPDRPMTAIGG